MKKKLTLILTTVLVILCLAAVAFAEAAPTLNIVEETLTVGKGKNAALTVETGNITDKKKPRIEWTVEDKAVASVANGKVTGKGAGSTVVTATVKLQDGTQLTDSCQVTVFVPTASLKITTKAKSMVAVDNKLTVACEVKPADATDTTLLWTSSDEAIATVDENGVVTGVATGDVTITATPADGGAKAARVQLKVVPAVSGTDYIRIGEYTLMKDENNHSYYLLEPFTTVRKAHLEDKNNKGDYIITLGVRNSPENKALGKITASALIDGVPAGKSVSWTCTDEGFIEFHEINVTKEIKKLEVGTHEVDINIAGTNKHFTFDISDGSDITGKPEDAKVEVMVLSSGMVDNEEGEVINPSRADIDAIGSNPDAEVEYYETFLRLTNGDAKTDFGEVNLYFQGEKIVSQHPGIIEPNGHTYLFFSICYFSNGEKHMDGADLAACEPGDYTIELEMNGNMISYPFTILP